jgi:hypothetical protein
MKENLVVDESKESRKGSINKYLGRIWTDRDPQRQTSFIHLVGQLAEFGDQNWTRQTSAL